MKKVYANADEALAGCVKDGMTLMAGVLVCAASQRR